MQIGPGLAVDNEDRENAEAFIREDLEFHVNKFGVYAVGIGKLKWW